MTSKMIYKVQVSADRVASPCNCQMKKDSDFLEILIREPRLWDLYMAARTLRDPSAYYSFKGAFSENLVGWNAEKQGYEPEYEWELVCEKFEKALGCRL